jgi:AcrR family transcriptional regulator
VSHAAHIPAGDGAILAISMVQPTARKPYSPRRSREERREQVLDAALRVLDEHGFVGFSIEAVARAADVAKTVVYDAVGNQQELLHALIVREQGRVTADIAKALPVPPFERPEDMLGDGVLRLLHGVRDHPATWRLILVPAEGAPPELRETVELHRSRLREYLVPIVSWGLEQIDAPEIEPEIATHALLASIESSIRLALTGPDDFTPERLAAFSRAIVRRVT